MKKLFTFIMPSLLMLVMFSACTDIDEPSNPNSAGTSNNGISKVIIKDGKIVNSTRTDSSDEDAALRFADEAAFQKYVDYVSSLDEENKVDTPHSLGVYTLSDLEEEADHELDSIAASVETEAEFRKLYTPYVSKYKGRLIGNYVDDSDLNLYAPVKDAEDIIYIANKNGEYAVGDEVVKIDGHTLPQSVIELSKVFLKGEKPNAESLPVNSISYSPKKSRRVNFSIKRYKYEIRVFMNVKKKMWYGWRTDRHRWVAFEPVLNNFIQATPKPENNVYWYGRQYQVRELIGRGTPLTGPMAKAPTVTGIVYVWSDYEMETNPDGIPKFWLGNIIVDRNRAKKVKVNLEPNNKKY